MPTARMVPAAANRQRNRIARWRCARAMLSRRASCSFSLILFHVSKVGNLDAEAMGVPSALVANRGIVRPTRPPGLHLPPGGAAIARVGPEVTSATVVSTAAHAKSSI